MWNDKSELGQLDNSCQGVQNSINALIFSKLCLTHLLYTTQKVFIFIEFLAIEITYMQTLKLRALIIHYSMNSSHALRLV